MIFVFTASRSAKAEGGPCVVIVCKQSEIVSAPRNDRAAGGAWGRGQGPRGLRTVILSPLPVQGESGALCRPLPAVSRDPEESILVVRKLEALFKARKRKSMPKSGS